MLPVIPVIDGNRTLSSHQLVFGGGRGLITYLLRTDQNRVDPQWP